MSVDLDSREINSTKDALRLEFNSKDLRKLHWLLFSDIGCGTGSALGTFALVSLKGDAFKYPPAIAKLLKKETTQRSEFIEFAHLLYPVVSFLNWLLLRHIPESDRFYITRTKIIDKLKGIVAKPNLAGLLCFTAANEYYRINRAVANYNPEDNLGQINVPNFLGTGLVQNVSILLCNVLINLFLP